MARPARLLRGARRRSRRLRGRDQEGLPQARARAASRTSTPTTRRPRRSSRRRPRPTRCSPTPSAGAPTTASATRGCARAAGRRGARGLRQLPGHLRALFGGGDPFGGSAARPGRRAATSGPWSRSRWRRCSRASEREVSLRGGRASASTAAATAPSPARRSTTCENCDGTGQLREVSRSIFGQVVPRDALRPLRRRRPDPRDALRALRRARGGSPRRAPGRSTSRPGSRTASGSGSPAPATPASPAAARATSTSRSGSPPDERFARQGTELDHPGAELPVTTAIARRRGRACRRSSGERHASRCQPGTQHGDADGARGRGPAAAARAAAAATSTWSSSSWCPTELSKEQREAGPERPRRDASAAQPSQAAMIRLAVRCEPEYAEPVLANLLELAPNGVEEERGPDWVEFAIYGAAGRGPRRSVSCRRPRAAASWTSPRPSVPDDWADRWVDFHRPIEVGGRIGVRPSWWDPQEGLIDVVVDPGRAFGTGGASDHPPVPRAAGRARGGRGGHRAARRLGHRLGCARDRRRPSSAGARSPAATASAPRWRRPGPTPRPTGSSWRSSGVDVREDPPPLAPTVVANLTAQSARGLRPSPAARRRRPGDDSSAPGCWTTEVDEVADAFAPLGLEQSRAPDRATTGRRCSCDAPRAADGARASARNCRSPSSTRASAGSPCSTSAWSRCPRRTTSTSATTPAFPTGPAPPSELREHVDQVSRFLLDRGAKLLVIACNSAASAGPGDGPRDRGRGRRRGGGGDRARGRDRRGADSQTGKVGVLATPATVRSGAYLARARRASTAR